MAGNISLPIRKLSKNTSLYSIMGYMKTRKLLFTVSNIVCSHLKASQRVFIKGFKTSFSRSKSKKWLIALLL